MSGREAYERSCAKRGIRAEWDSLPNAERETWNRGAAMAPTIGTLRITQASDTKTR